MLGTLRKMLGHWRTNVWVKRVEMLGLWESKNMAETFRLLNQKSLTTENIFRSLTKTYSIIGQTQIIDSTTPLNLA